MTKLNLYSKEQIDALNIGKETDTASATGSLWARIENALTRIVSLETADSNNVKKTGTSIVTGTLEVPTTPPTPTSAVNSAYVNDASDGVNNIVHKSGAETITGNKTFAGTSTFSLVNPSSTVPYINQTFASGRYQKICGFQYLANLIIIMELNATDGTHASFQVNGGGTQDEFTGEGYQIATSTGTFIEPFVIKNTTTGLSELWIYRSNAGRYNLYVKSVVSYNTPSSIDTVLTKYGTKQTTDPYGTADYQTGGENNPKYYVSMVNGLTTGFAGLTTNNTFTGINTVPTPTSSSGATQVANKEYVDHAIQIALNNL